MQPPWRPKCHPFGIWIFEIWGCFYSGSSVSTFPIDLGLFFPPAFFSVFSWPRRLSKKSRGKEMAAAMQCRLQESWSVVFFQCFFFTQISFQCSYLVHNEIVWYLFLFGTPLCVGTKNFCFMIYFMPQAENCFRWWALSMQIGWLQSRVDGFQRQQGREREISHGSKSPQFQRIPCSAPTGASCMLAIFKVFVFFLRIKTAGFFGFSNLRNCEAWGKAGNIHRCVLEHVLFCRTVSKKLWNKNPWTYGPDGFTALNFQPNISQRCFRFFAMLSIEGPITLLLVVLFAHFIAKRPVSWLKKSSFRVISLKLSHLVVPERGWKHQNRSVVNIVITGQLESTCQLYQIIHQCTINVFDLPRYQQKSFELFSNEDSQPGGVLWCENQVDCCRGAITSLVSWLANWKTHSLTIHLKGKDFQWWNEQRGEMKETKDQACFFLCSWIVLAASVCVCVCEDMQCTRIKKQHEHIHILWLLM